MTNLPTEALREFLLAFADDEHLMGQQHTEWIGVAPFLEEDLALASIGQDELGHAAMLYELVCELDGVEPTDEAIDALAYGRGAEEYRSCAFVEFGTTDWAQALVRHWVYDMVEAMRWSQVAESSYEPLAQLAVRVEREERYHRMHAAAVVDALLTSDDAAQILRAALDTLQPLIAGLIAPTSGHPELLEAGVVSRTSTPLKSIGHALEDIFVMGVEIGATPVRGPQRSEHFAPLMARMREVLDLDPAAQW